MRRIKISLLLIFAIAILASCALWGRSASADNQSPITYHNGPVMAGTSNVYVIWYGNWSASTGPNSLDTQIILINFLTEIGGSINFQINATYPGVNGTPSGALIFGGTDVSSYTHGTELDAAAIQGIVAESFSSNGFLYDPKGIYLVVASSDVGSNATGFCTPNTPPHHGFFNQSGGQQVKYAFIGNPARCPSAAAPQFFAPDGSQLPTPNGNLAADAMASTILHALDTTITDPFHTAWFDEFGLENADKCQNSFSKTSTIANGARVNFTRGVHNYLIQDNWVNNFGGYCGQQNDAPPRADDQTVQVIRDTAKSITLTAVDDNGDPLTFSIVTPPQHGTLTGSGANRTYTPANNFFGADRFTFKANDGTLDSEVATVSINVNTNSALDGFDPNANGLVRVAVVQPDGKILIGGDFTTLAPNGRLPVTRNYIARLNTDGTVDPTFNPSANSSIQAIALQPDGKIILGGDFNAFAPNGGASIIRGNIARFNADGTIDPTLDPRGNGSVHAIAVQADGGIVIGGEFQGFNPGGGATVFRNRIARLNPNGSLDSTFDPKANNAVETLAVQSDGRILMGGRFTTLAPNGGATVTRNYVARLNIDGTLDTAFNPNPDSILGGIAVQADGKILIGGAFITLTPNGGSLIPRNHLARLNADGTVDVAFNPNLNSFVRNIILQPDGKILIGGGFLSLAPNGGPSVPRKYIARLNPDGTLDPEVDANPNDQVWAIAVQPDGKTIVGGVFYSSNSFRGQTRNRIARLEKDGRLDQSLNLNTGGISVTAIAFQPDGKILIGGVFNTILGVARKNIARLNSDGTLDTTFNIDTNGYVAAIAVQPDGKILIAGDFTAVILNGTASVPSVSIGFTRNHIARMNADGTIDAFDPNVDDTVNALAVQPDGKILIGGFFTALAPNGEASVARNVMARLDTDGKVDSTFNPNPNLDVYAIALQPDGKILVGGAFTTLAPNGGAVIPRNFIARLNTDGTVETAFDPNANDQVKAFAVQSDGKIIIGGSFTTLAPFGAASVTRNRIARLNVDGAIDNAFNPNANNTVTSVALQADGKILIGGSFATLAPNGGASEARNAFARLNADGTVDAFDPQPNNEVFSITLQPDGKVLVGGAFDTIGGQSRSRFARLANDTPAIQNLAVTQTSMTWTRSGAEPQLSRVSFERSTDGVNYTPLGNGTRVGTSNDFALAGQNLPTQQNLYVRARGLYRGGHDNVSESITESVRNVFLPPAFHLSFAQQPTNTPENGTITPAVTVQILDASNTLVNSTAAVTVGIGANPSSGTLAGTKTVSAVGGTATFNNLSIDKLGTGYTLNASGTGLTGAVSSPFNITVNAPSNIVATAGSAQSAIINSTFATALQAKVTDVNGNPVSGVVVSFNAPANGASGTFANNTTTATATTDANGVATGPSFSANGTAGLYSVLASINGGSISTAFSLANAKANQTIIVTTHAPAGATFNTQFSVAAGSSAGLTVSYSSSGACTNNGATFTMNSGTGICTVNYNQGGDANHNAAQPTTETVTAQKAAQAITFDAIADKVLGNSDFAVSATSSSGLSVNFAASGNCTSTGSTVHLTGAGSCTITGSQPGNSAYDAAPDIARSFNIARAGSTTIVTVSDAIYDGNAHGGSATATGAGGLTENLTVSYTGRNGTIFSSTSAPTNAGDYTASATFDGDANHNGSSDSKNFTIARASQTIDFNALSNKTFGAADFAVNASSSSGLSLVFAASGQCTISGLNVHITGAGGCIVTASQPGDANYNAAADVLRSFQIDKATQTITFDSLPGKTFGDADFVVNASSSSGLSVIFAASGQCTISGLNVHITGAGDCTVTASQPGDANYNAAADVLRSFQINKATQTISFDVLSDKTFGDPDFQISASATSGRPVTFATSGQCANSGPTVHISGAGSCTVTASEGGDANYNAATEVQRSFQIARAGQTITFDAIAGKTFGDPDFQISASATSGRPVTFATSGQCANSGANVHISGAGSCTITASEGGDANYNAATEVQRSFEIARAGQTITFDAIAGKTFGDPDFQVSASATSGRPVTFATSGQCTNSGASVHISGAGSCTVTASEGGDANYNAAAEVQRSFQIARAGQTITIDAIAGKTFGDPDFQVSASATSGRPVTFATSGQCVNSGASVHISGAGSCTVTAAEGGDANYNAAPDVASSFQISKASTATALSSSANLPNVGQSVTFTAAVTSGVGAPGGTVTFKYDGAAITSCSDVALQSGSANCVSSALSAGTHTLTAEYSGEANFEPSAGTLITEELAGSVFQFSQASYGVAERGGFVTITVQRTGDLTAPASVEYATDDGSIPSVDVGCSLVTGFALERCDYTRAAGTLQFAANETEKSFIVLVNDDSYVEGLETTSLTLSNPGGSTAIGPRATSTLQIMDDLVESFGNPADDGANFVRQHYHDFLNREPDSGGLQFWTNNLASCDTDGCPEVKRIDTSAAFFLSIEFQETGYLVERFYKVAYGDATGASTFGGPHQLSVPIIRWREFLHDTQQIGNRVIVGQAAWQQQLEDQKQAFAREFISRARFTIRYPASLSAEQFVNQLNANTGGVLTSAEITQLEEIFGGAGATSADAAKRAQVLRTIAESHALQQKEFNRAFVLMQYFGYLRRNPDDAQDTDYTGYDFWLQKLERFGGNYANAEMVKAFVSSIEYRQRFGQ